MKLPSPGSSYPRIVITTGLHGSASTWVFNVARELMLTAVGENSLVSCFTASPAALLAQPRLIESHLVCKTHGWPHLHVFASLTSAALIVSVRDPRDCVASYMERFGQPFSHAVAALMPDCQHAITCADAGAHVLRYEDRFFADTNALRLIATYIGITVNDSIIGEIFQRYSTDAVRAFAARIETLSRERLEGNGNPHLFDRITHITRAHIGDGRIGKWRERFDAQQRNALTRSFSAFLGRFNYAT